MKKRKLQKGALLSESSGFGQSGRKETLAAASKLGIEIVSDETYNAKDTDMTAQLTKIGGVAGVQVLFVFGLGQGPALVSKNIGQLGLKLPIYQSHGVASNEFIKLAGPAAEGTRLPAAALLVADKLPANDVQKPLVSESTRSYQERYKGEVSTLPRPACPSRASGWPHARPRDRVSRVASVFLFHTCRHQYPGGTTGCSCRSLHL